MLNNWKDIRKELPKIPKGKYAIRVLAVILDHCWVFDLGNKPDVFEVFFYSDHGFDKEITSDGHLIDRIDPVILWDYLPDAPTPDEIKGLLYGNK